MAKCHLRVRTRFITAAECNRCSDETIRAVRAIPPSTSSNGSAVIQGVVVLFSFVYVLVNLLVDLVYTLLDPRIRY